MTPEQSSSGYYATGEASASTFSAAVLPPASQRYPSASISGFQKPGWYTIHLWQPNGSLLPHSRNNRSGLTSKEKWRATWKGARRKPAILSPAQDQKISSPPLNRLR